MYNADYAVARCLSVCRSHARILSKRLDISSNLFSPSVSHTILVFFTPNGMIIFRRGPLTGASNARGYEKLQLSTSVSLYLRNKIQRTGNLTKLSNGTIFNDFEWPLAQISRSRYYSTPNNSIIIQNRATLTMTDQMNVVKRRHFQWPWTTPNPYFKVAAFVDAEHLSNSK